MARALRDARELPASASAISRPAVSAALGSILRTLADCLPIEGSCSINHKALVVLRKRGESRRPRRFVFNLDSERTVGIHRFSVPLLGAWRADAIKETD
jgi:hypothetical protein